MEINGKLTVIGDIQHIGDSFRKREFVITTEEQYPQHIQLEFHGDNCAFLDYYRIGEYVKVLFNLRGRMWTNPEMVNKYFNTLAAWKIERLNTEQAPAPSTPAQAALPTQDAPAIREEDQDDLPF